MKSVNVSRRRFLRTTAVVGGGLVVGTTLAGCSRDPLPIDKLSNSLIPNAFLQITPDNAIHFYCPRDEMGQGVTTGLATLVGEELDVDPAAFTIELAGVHSDYNNPGMGVQGTGGSNSLKAHYLQLRQVGADTRALLLDAAARDLGVARDSLTTDDGHVLAGGKRYPYGDFVATAAALAVPDSAPLKAAGDFRWIGHEFPRLDAMAKSTGTAVFGIDVDIEGMHHAVVRRSPVAGARLVSVDKSAALGMPGVTDVLEIGSGVAVVAGKYWQAKKAAAALDPVWEDVALASVDTDTVRRDYEAALGSEDGLVGPEEGDVEAGREAAAQVLEAKYWTPYLAHAPMEPMNAVLKIENGEAEIWTGSQGPVGVQGLVSRFSGIEPEKVKVHATYLGGGFGRRGTLTHVIEITQIAMATGKPIHLLWSREEDIKHGVYRPASLMKIAAGVSADGRITAWDAERVGGNITPQTLKTMLPGLFPGLGDGTVDWLVGVSRGVFDDWMIDPSSIEGLFEDYDFENVKVTHTTVDHGVPLTFWRSVGHSYTAFATESMMDELAVAAEIDPVEFRLKNTTNKPRLQNVIRIAREHMRTMRSAEGHHLGFAAHHSFATDVAEIAEVSVEDGAIRVHKVVCVVDCGLAVNPDVVRAQMEGGIMFGLTAALHGDLNLADGAFKESNFHDYPILRMNEAPEVEVIIVDSGTEPTGVGEPGLPPIAPAVANAVYRATGQRLRSLPLKLA
jgi:isoquinoline 1-oxidoreductase/isoquinoline 1-oxidoreductase beta subunit